MAFPSLNMNTLRFRFAIGFSILFTLCFAFALLVIYFSYADFRKEVFYSRLKDKAVTTFRLLVEIEKIDAELLKEIDRNTLNSLYDEKVIVLHQNEIIYSSIDDQDIFYDDKLLEEISRKKEISFVQNENDVFGIVMNRQVQEYYVLVSAYDKYGKGKLYFLKWLLVIVYIIGMIVGLAGTYLFVRRTIKPLNELKNDLQSIDYNNLNVRLPEDKRGEEVNSLSVNVNGMLERLEQSVAFQKDFIKYASHELRTPLAAMISITENAMRANQEKPEYMKIFTSLLQQEKDLAGITNSLMFLSDVKLAADGLEYPLVRLDEIVFHSLDIIRNLFPEAGIDVQIEGGIENEKSFLVPAYEPLILVAFNNLLKNAIQYSDDKHAKIILKISDESKKVVFMNKGERIDEKEMSRIFSPFYRAENALRVKGSGLGLALVHQTARLHNANINYSYEDGFNVFRFSFSN